MIFKFKIVNGKAIFKTRAQAGAYSDLLGSYNNSGKTLVVDIQEYSKNITEAQYSLYKALLIEGSRISGYTYNEYAKVIEEKFLPVKYQKDIFDQVISVKIEIKELNHAQFQVFIEQAVAWSNAFWNINFQL